MTVQELQIGDTKVAVSQEKPEAFLGRLVWYSVRNMRIPHEELEKLLDETGVPDAYRPRRTRPCDAFRTAVRSAQGSEYLVESETTLDASGYRKVDSKKMLVVSRVHEQASDSLPVVLTATFMPESSSIDFSGAPLELIRYIEAEYDVNRTTYNDQDIRGMAVDAIHGAYAVNVKQTGGVYFIPELYAQGVESLAKVIGLLPGCDMVSVPVIDREPERKTLLKQYEKATLERLGELMTMVRETVAKGEEIVPSIYKRFREEVAYLVEQKSKYEELLNTAMGKVDVEMHVLQSDLAKLATLIREDKPATAG